MTTGLASLALLKGQQKEDTQVAKAAKTPAPEAAEDVTDVADAADDSVEVEVDVDTMDAKQIAQLIEDYSIETPPNWKTMKIAEKRQWLKDTFEDGTQTEDEIEADRAAAAEAPAEEAADEPEVEDAAEEDVADEPAAEPEAEPEAAPDAKPAAKTPAKAKATGKAKGTTKDVATKGIEGEIITPTDIADETMASVVSTIENLKEQDAKELVALLSATADQTYFKMGGVLSKIQKQGWFAPHPTFKDFVQNEYGMNYRRAVYWVAIYDNLVANHIPWDKVKAIGWTKLKEIATLLSPDNIDKWVKLCADNNTLQITAIADAEKKKLNGAGNESAEGQEVKTVTSKTFKLHDDQKANVDMALEKAMAVGGTANPTVALDYICMDFLGSGNKKPLVDTIRDMGEEEALKLLAEAFPELDITTGE